MHYVVSSHFFSTCIFYHSFIKSACISVCASCFPNCLMFYRTNADSLQDIRYFRHNPVPHNAYYVVQVFSYAALTASSAWKGTIMRKKAYRLHISSMLAILLATSCFFIMTRPSRAHKLLIIPELEETQTHSLLSVKVHGNGSFFDGKAYRKEGTYVLTRHRRKLFSLLPDNGCELVQLVLNDEKIPAANTDDRLIISGSQKEQQLILYFRKTP